LQNTGRRVREFIINQTLAISELSPDVFSRRIFARIDRASRPVASSPPNDLFYSSLKYIPSQASTRSWPGVGASYRTPRTIARRLTMASLAMASGSVLYSSACKSTKVSCTGCPKIANQPFIDFSPKLK